MSDLDFGTLRWLLGLARRQVRSHERNLLRFHAHDGQSEEEAEAVRAAFVRHIAWEHAVIAHLEDLSRKDRNA